MSLKIKDYWQIIVISEKVIDNFSEQYGQETEDGKLHDTAISTPLQYTLK
jgi:hypothetical protein